MNLYFLVEGRSTEKKIYPKWIEYLLPDLERVKFSDQVINNNYYLISGKGYPRILQDGLENAIDKILEVNIYDYLVLCVDSDEEPVSQRINYIEEKINDFLHQKNLSLGKTKIEIIVQNRCMETWLLGNRKIFSSKQPLEKPLSEYAKYYDVSQEDPEQMGANDMRNHADFHYEYLKRIFEAKKLVYTKNSPNQAKERHYLQALQSRVNSQPNHLKTFKNFLDFCERIKDDMQAV